MILDFQKASSLKRISAFLIDFILVVVFATLFAFLISWITNYSSYVAEFKNYYLEYEQLFGIPLTDEEAFNAFTPEQLELYNQAIEAMNNDEAVLKCYGLLMSLPIVMVSIGIVLSSLIVEFIMPLILKNGQTIGKKIFGIAVIRPNGVKASHFQLFARGILGKCVFLYLIPGIILVMMMLGRIGIVGPLMLLVLLIVQTVIYFKNPERFLLHDLIAYTACCDKSTQLICNSEDELIKLKEQINKEKALEASD